MHYNFKLNGVGNMITNYKYTYEEVCSKRKGMYPRFVRVAVNGLGCYFGIIMFVLLTISKHKPLPVAIQGLIPH